MVDYKKTDELIAEGLSQGYDTSIMSQMPKEVLLFLYNLGDYINWEFLVTEKEGSKITEEDILAPILKTEHVYAPKIKLLKDCLDLDLDIEPLIQHNYTYHEMFAIYCGLAKGVKKEDFLSDSGPLDIETIQKITRNHPMPDTIEYGYGQILRKDSIL